MIFRNIIIARLFELLFFIQMILSFIFIHLVASREKCKSITINGFLFCLFWKCKCHWLQRKLDK